MSHVQSHLLNGAGKSLWTFVDEGSTVDGCSDEMLSDDAGDAAISSMVQLPEPRLGNLTEIEMMIRQASSTVQGRDALAKYIINEDWVAKLVPRLEEAEDLESLDHLHRLCNIMKMVILLNDTLIVESIVSDEMVLGVVGILECVYCPVRTSGLRELMHLRRSRFPEPQGEPPAVPERQVKV